MLLSSFGKIGSLNTSQAINELYVNLSSNSKEKEEKRPWILRAREHTKEAFVQFGKEKTSDDTPSLPHTLIYISCGWESFKEVLVVVRHFIFSCQNNVLCLVGKFQLLLGCFSQADLEETVYDTGLQVTVEK